MARIEKYSDGGNETDLNPKLNLFLFVAKGWFGSSNRYRSNVHSASISDGMLFVGCGTREDCEYDQRQVFIFDVSCVYFFIFPGIRTNIDTMKQLLAESS